MPSKAPIPPMIPEDVEVKYHIGPGNPFEPAPIDMIARKAVDKVNAIRGAGKSKASKVLINGPGKNAKRIKITENIINNAYRKLESIVDGDITIENISTISAYAMQISNEVLKTSKTYKVELSLAILRKLINEKVGDSTHRMMLHMLVEATLPSLINTINGLPNKLFRTFSKCWPKKK
jgi:hypothetical protein